MHVEDPISTYRFSYPRLSLLLRIKYIAGLYVFIEHNRHLIQSAREEISTGKGFI